MAKLIIIPEEDYNVVKKYLPSGGFPGSRAGHQRL